ncbi:zinc finger [Stylonychia lemnae]|uniref:Zinc finger n=1 Tax=Stylonychia lemnae TaxID=5949 RepID=A0A078B951_STYLE|nr:zinc finger [Stylonychia lemnae]|eukprot:CDW90766.1 zinc finger [Stylonychia lemnae]
MEKSSHQPEEEQKQTAQKQDSNTIMQTPLFLNLEENTPSEEIESLCMNCQEMGKTKFLFTKIPFFKEIILSSFECPNCGWKNTEIQFGGKIADFGIRYELKVVNQVNMNRSVVKSENATIRIPELDLEIPPETQKGTINTLEGFIAKTIEGLQDLQEERRKVDPATAEKIDDFVNRMQDYIDGKKFPFTFIVDDPSGNSYVQNPNAPSKDEYCTTEFYPRSADDYIKMGYNPELAESQADEDKAKHDEFVKDKSKSSSSKIKAKKGQTPEEQEAILAKIQAYASRKKDEEITASNMDFSKPMDDASNTYEDDDVRKEVMRFSTYCYCCSKEGEAKMCIATIPFFKEIIIMAFCCDYCGYRNTDIKHGGGISDKATRIVFKCEKPSDLNRDVFKSDTGIMAIPELDFAMAPGTLGGVYTTIEGLIDKVADNLEEFNPFGSGDSSTNKKYVEFIKKLRGLKDMSTPFTLILDDALSNCFIYNPFAPEDDPQINVTVYERSEEQNEELGINDMNC